MYQIKCCLFVVCLCFVEIKAQFRIVGLLNVDQQQINVEHNSSAYQTNAQGRGFSVDENVKRSSAVRPKNIIRVRIIDDLTSKNDFVPNADNIFMVEANKEEIKRSFGYRRLQATKPSKTDVKLYQKKRSHSQRIVMQSDKSKYQRISKNDIPDNPAASYNNPINFKSQKAAKYRNRFKSRCRCERISNCPKIQITVSRCEPNYFLCCF